MTEELARLQQALAGRYAIEREIGSGGMASVYLADDLKHRRKVAIKVLRPDLSASLEAERFLREIDLAAKLQHPHILPLYDSGKAETFLYYVMPFVEGRSLRDKLDQEGELPVADVVRILRDVVDALTEAHARGVVHRDIKPANVLLRGRHALVADFGVAKAVSQAAERQPITSAGVAVGTAAYMAPEQATADPHTDHRADVYAVGAMAYEMLTGQPPFTARNWEALVAAQVTEAPVDVARRRPAIPQALGDLVMSCLAKKPADRCTAEQLLPVLEALNTPSGSVAPTLERPKPGALARLKARWPLMAAVAAVALAALAIGYWMLSGAGSPRHPRAAVAVLPFQNLSVEGPYGYFAGGLHDELLTQLAKVAALSVRGRTSVMGYAGTTKTIKEIADELSVGSIVEGSVQVVGDRLRVNVQLLDAETDVHLWAERYDRTLDDAFAIQSDIAQRIVSAVGATIGETEQVAIVGAPTANAEAYRLYLQGREYFGRPGMLLRNWEIAQDYYQRALALDSGFALAHAALSELHGQMSWFRYDPSPERLARQREEVETALRLAPDLPQAHSAMGLLQYAARRDWEAALAEFRAALVGMPSSPELWAWVGYAHRRLGDCGQAMVAFDKVVALDPRNVDVLFEGASTLRFLHRYREAAEWYARSVRVAPEVIEGDVQRGWVFALWQGRLDSLGAALDRYALEADLSGGNSIAAELAQKLYWQREPDRLLALLRDTHRAVFDAQDFYFPAALYAAWAHQLRGDQASARAAFRISLALLDSVAAALPDDWRVHVARGLALAGLERRAEALSEARWLAQSAFYREDRFQGTLAGEGRARILAQTGAADEALEEIQRLLAAPSWISVHTLRLDPRWDPIRGDPRFQALLVKYADQDQVS